MFATGSRTLAHCERCGRRYRHKELHKEWSGFLVCPTCHDPKPAERSPRRLGSEAVMVKNARPDQDASTADAIIDPDADELSDLITFPQGLRSLE